MISSAVLAMLAFTQSARPAAPPPDSPAPAPEARIEPYAGSFAAGLAEIQAVCEAGDRVRALAVGAALLAQDSFSRWRDEKIAQEGFAGRALRAAAPVFEFLDWQGHTPGERAAVHYALGVVHSRAGEHHESVQAFSRARELSGAGALRLDAIYNLGVLALEQGEELRKTIPELNGGQQAPPAQPAAPPVPGAPAAPDPLEQAIQAYLHARTELIERLKLDWQDADTRANLELVQRRLKELDELKQKREEEQQKQENKDQQQKDKDKQDSKDSKDKSKDQQDQDKSKDESKENPKDQKPDEKPPEDQQKPEDQPKPDEQQQDDKKQETPQDPGEPQERLLTKEEMMRLFDLLKQTEEQGKRLEQQLRQVRRAKVKKDW